MNQTTNYGYNLDNTIASINYVANLPTPSVSFIYDPAYPRQTSMTDGNGTTTYTYHPVTSSPALGANLLASIVSPVAGTSNTDTVTYSYDALNRASATSINGASQSVGFDAIGRVISASNPLDAFTYGHSDGTARVSSISSTAGPSAALTYYGPTGDELLEQASYTAHTGGTSLQQFGYAYNSDDNVTSFSVTQPAAQSTTYSYDKANRLVSALIGTGSPQYVYKYDYGSNLTSITPDGATQNYSYTSTNTITSGSYDANGSPSVLAGASYKWDGASRIVRYTNAANNTNTTFVYDGLNRLVRVIDTHAGTITADHSYSWCGGAFPCLAHDNTQSGSPVSTQYFAQGAIVSGIGYYYLKDEQGGVRELVGSTGSVAAQYSYDPYGNKSTLSGSVVSDIGYAGYYYHPDSSLNFAVFRGYDSSHARWLNRDPIGEAGGVDLYAYVGDNPMSLEDPLGLAPHYYQVTDFICYAGQIGCTPQNVFNQLRRYPAPFSDGNPVTTGDTSDIPGLGSVVYTVDPTHCSVTNKARPGHLLYPGQVTRSVMQGSDGSVYVVTTGTGDGSFAALNDVLADPLWAVVDWNVASPWIAKPPAFNH